MYSSFFIYGFIQVLLVHPCTFPCFPALQDEPFLEEVILKINQLSRTPLLSKVTSPGILPSRSLNQTKSVLKFRIVILLFALLPPFRNLNFTSNGHCSQGCPQSSYPHTSSYLFVRSGLSGCALSLAPLSPVLGSYHQCTPETWIAYVLLCCPSSRYQGD